VTAVETSTILTPEQAELLRLPFLYKGFGWCLTRVRTRTKAPVDMGWQNAPPPSDEQLIAWFSNGEFSPGLRLGSISGNLYDLECDDEGMIPFVEWFKPAWAKECPTWARSGRPHVLVRSDESLPNLRFSLAGHCVLELRGDGEQSVLPPGIHPSGDRYMWIGEPHQPPLASGSEVREWLQNAVVAFALRQGWNEGSRHDQSLAAAGWMSRLGIPLERALRIIECVALSDGPEARDRDRGVRGTYDALASGEPATGWPTLERLVPAETARLLRQVWPKQQNDDEERAGPYVVRNGGTLWRKPTGDDTWKDVLLANFDLRISREIRRDDGSDFVPTLFEMSGRNATTSLPVAQVATSEFSGMQWVVPSYGTGAIISAGQGLRDREREAIQRFSGEPLRCTVYTHSGWRPINGVWRFLHSGLSDDIEVDLEGGLARYRLPPVPADPRDAIDCSLSLLDLGDAPAVTALWCAMYLAPLSSILQPDFTLWLWGPTGSFKSTLAGLFLSHFGDFDRKSLPADWSSTDNALERLAFLAKDVPLVIDEFAPPPGRAEQQKLQAKASRILRAQGNLAGRGRMRADTSLRSGFAPRGVVITLNVELTKGGIDTSRLQSAQVSADQLSLAMASYIDCLAQRYDELLPALRTAFKQARAAQQDRGHRRIPEALANLEVAASLALKAFTDLGAISLERAAELMTRIQRDLATLGAGQEEAVAVGHPGKRFLNVIAEGFAKKSILCVGRDGREPVGCDELGWELHEVAETGGLAPRFTPSPRATRVGWADEDWLYLLPAEAYRYVVRFLGESDQTLGASEQSLHRLLEEMGVLEVRGDGTAVRRTLLVMLEDKQHRVLKIRRSAFTEGPDR